MFKKEEYGFVLDCVASYVDKSTGKQKRYKWASVWGFMINRCYNKDNKDYSGYGAKGCYVSDEFKIASNFRDFYEENNPNGDLVMDKDIKGKELGLFCYSRDTISFISVTENTKEIHSRISYKGSNNPACKPLSYYEVNGSTRSNFKQMCSKRNLNFEDFLEIFTRWYTKPNGVRQSLYLYKLRGEN